MNINDEKIIKTLLENYNNLTWTDTNALIDGLSDTIKPYIYQIIIDNPTPKTKSGLRELLSKIEEKKKKKIKKEYQYKCCHYNCTEPAIQSHVISKSAVLAPLANASNEMYYFASDINSNPTKCIFKERHIDYISSFPGYCKKHDRDIFRELDEASSINAKFVNLSVMRVLKKQIFDLRLEIALQDEHSELWNDKCLEYINKQEDIDLIALENANEYFISMNEKVKIMKNNINRYESLYDKIFGGIDKSTALKFNIMKVKYVRSCFSIMIDAQLEDGSAGEPHFVFYLPVNEHGCIIVAKDNSEKNYDPMVVDEDGALSIYFWMLVLMKKESLFFSEEMLSVFSNQQKSILNTNYNYFDVTPIEAIIISQIYLD